MQGQVTSPSSKIGLPAAWVSDVMISAMALSSSPVSPLNNGSSSMSLTFTIVVSSLLPRLLPVALAQHDVDRAAAGDHVGHHVAGHHLRQRADVHIRWGADLHAVRLAAPVTHDEEPELALGRLGRDIDL